MLPEIKIKISKFNIVDIVSAQYILIVCTMNMK